jgi:hypothetical protein
MMNAHMVAFNDYKGGEQIGNLNDNRRWRVFELAGEHEEDFIVATDGKLIYKWLYIADKGTPTLEDTEKIEIGMSLEEVFIVMGREQFRIVSPYAGPLSYVWEIEGGKMFWVDLGVDRITDTYIRDEW